MALADGIEQLGNTHIELGPPMFGQNVFLHRAVGIDGAQKLEIQQQGLVIDGAFFLGTGHVVAFMQFIVPDFEAEQFFDALEIPLQGPQGTTGRVREPLAHGPFHVSHQFLDPDRSPASSQFVHNQSHPPDLVVFCHVFCLCVIYHGKFRHEKTFRRTTCFVIRPPYLCPVPAPIRAAHGNSPQGCVWARTPRLSDGKSGNCRIFATHFPEFRKDADIRDTEKAV